MKKLLATCLLLSLTGCLGNSSSDNELIGQVKKVQHITPIIFADYDRVDVSLGVVQNGTGSMSKEDVWLYVPSESDLATLKAASESGQLVKIKYNEARFRWYVENEYVTSVQIKN